jgi:hypothetical protein
LHSLKAAFSIEEKILIRAKIATPSNDRVLMNDWHPKSLHCEIIKKIEAK